MLARTGNGEAGAYGITEQFRQQILPIDPGSSAGSYHSCTLIRIGHRRFAAPLIVCSTIMLLDSCSMWARVQQSCLAP